MRKTPFGKIKKKVVPVFPHTEYGDVFLISTGFPDPNIYPEEIQESERSAGTVQYLLNTAAVRLAEKIGCQPIEAKKLFAPQIREYKYENYLNNQEIEILREILTKASVNLSEKEKIGKDEARSRLGDPLVQDTEIVYDYTMYLNEQELGKLFESMPSGGDREKEIRTAVTLIMRHRVVKCAKVVDTNIVDSWFPIEIGDRFRFNNQILSVLQFDGETGAIAFQGFGNIPVGSDLFLIKTNTSNDVDYGDPDWSEEESLALKSIWSRDKNAFDAVYEFFQKEITGSNKNIEAETTDPTLGENSANLPDTSPPLQLVGASSTGE